MTNHSKIPLSLSLLRPKDRMLIEALARGFSADAREFRQLALRVTRRQRGARSTAV